MTSVIFNEPSQDAVNVFQLLRERHNVLISGAPATGKTRLLAEIKHWFSISPNPAFHATGNSAFPASGNGIAEILPSPDKTERLVYTTTFHQGTKYRDFVSGMIPDPTSDTTRFCVTCGPLYKAAEAANSDNCATLLLVDEINRGPAVAIFGDMINAIESDKRKRPDGQNGPLTNTFRLLRENGEFVDFSLPYHLYIVAAMNQADTSVEPLDVAFLRRFEPYKLFPEESVVRGFLGLPSTESGRLSSMPSSPSNVYESLVRAWKRINGIIELARGQEFQIGHGIFMQEYSEAPDNLEKSKQFALRAWCRLFSHLEEVFFGDTRGLAAAIQADTPGNPFKLENVDFAETSIPRLHVPRSITPDEIYGLLCSIAEEV